MRSSSGSRHRHVAFEPVDSVTRMTAASFTNALLSPPPTAKKSIQSLQNDQNYSSKFAQKNSNVKSNGDPELKSLTKDKKKITGNQKSNFIFDNKPKNMSQGKFDLMQLGIDLDEDLITRLQDKIGIDSILSFVNSASSIVQDRRSPLEPGGLRETSLKFCANNTATNLIPVPSANETASKKSISNQFNNVVYGDKSPPLSNQRIKTKSLYNNYPVDNDENNFKIASDLISRLMNQDPTIIDPKYRQAIIKLIETLSLQYYHNSERFISIFLGQKYTPKKINRNELNLRIIQWILDKRYVSENDFKAMISRVLSSHFQVLYNNLNEILSIFFQLICHDKNFYNNSNMMNNNLSATNTRHNSSINFNNETDSKIIKKKVVDLWHFLTLLRVFNQQIRRSFDNRNSILANDVEFWKKFNQVFNSQSINVDKNTVVKESLSSNITKKSDDYRIDPHPNSCIGKIKRSFSTPKSRNYVYSTPHSTKPQEECRFIFGTIEKERIKDGKETVSVGNALYSNVSSEIKNTSIKFRDILKSEDVLPINKPTNMLESLSVSYLLNQNDLIQKQNNHYTQKIVSQPSNFVDSPPPPPSFSTTPPNLKSNTQPPKE